MSILGNVNDGWFAQLAHGIESVGRSMLNLISCGNGWGDKLYDNMATAATAHVETINQKAITQALRRSATKQQAIAAGSSAMERLINPNRAKEVAELFSAGSSVSLDAVNKTVAPSDLSILGSLIPLLVSVGVLGGTYLATDALSNNS